jgi:hypothetical protein
MSDKLSLCVGDVDDNDDDADDLNLYIYVGSKRVGRWETLFLDAERL